MRARPHKGGSSAAAVECFACQRRVTNRPRVSRLVFPYHTLCCVVVAFEAIARAYANPHGVIHAGIYTTPKGTRASPNHNIVCLHEDVRCYTIVPVQSLGRFAIVDTHIVTKKYKRKYKYNSRGFSRQTTRSEKERWRVQRSRAAAARNKCTVLILSVVSYSSWFVLAGSSSSRIRVCVHRAARVRSSCTGVLCVVCMRMCLCFVYVRAHVACFVCTVVVVVVAVCCVPCTRVTQRAEY